MIRTGACLASLAVLAAFLCGAGPARAQTALRYKLKVGDQLDYELEQQHHLKMSLQGKEATIELTQLIDLTWDVTARGDGKITIRQKFTRFRFTMDAPTGKVEYDSKNGELPGGDAADLVPYLKAMSGAEFTVTMTQRGEITDVTLPEKLAKALKDAQGKGRGPASREEFEALARDAVLLLPADDLDKGDSWTQQREVKQPWGKSEVKNVCTYQGPVKRDTTTLQEIAIKPAVTFRQAPGSRVTAELKSQEGKGTALFDSAAGRLVEMSLTHEMQMDVSTAGQDVSQTVRQSISLKLRDKAK